MYQTKDGRFVAISTANEGLFVRLATLMGRVDLTENPKFCKNLLRKQNVDKLDQIIGAWCAQYDADTLVDMPDAAKVPAGKMQTVFDLLEDPQIAAREMLIEQEIPGLGRFRFPGTPCSTDRRAPELGEHTEKILRRCGYSSEKIAALRVQHAAEWIDF